MTPSGVVRESTFSRRDAALVEVRHHAPRFSTSGRVITRSVSVVVTKSNYFTRMIVQAETC